MTPSLAAARPQPPRALSLFLSRNQLTGPAFPPAWLRANASLDVKALSLRGNARLGGALPSRLPWRSLQWM